MRLDDAAIIAEAKLRRYLLVPRAKSDKSAFFKRAGYTPANWQQLATDLREQVLPLEAQLAQQSVYGDVYTITGALVGPNGTRLSIVTVWIVERGGEITRFITAYPA